jgi:predicted AlkP superfamily pyrophosphatase or phosphodiesterase
MMMMRLAMDFISGHLPGQLDNGEPAFIDQRANVPVDGCNTQPPDLASCQFQNFARSERPIGPLECPADRSALPGITFHPAAPWFWRPLRQNSNVVRAPNPNSIANCMRLTVLWTLTLIPTIRLPAQGSAAKPPRLVVALAIDQFRPDYLDRWRSQFTGGFALLLRDGVFYPRGEQDHAITETAPGHSTMMSGRSPASTGIVTNDLGVTDSASPVLLSSAMGASPRRFKGTTLLDWMFARDPNTKSLSVSRKDRGAILPIGRSRGPVFWWSQGRFTTSRYYADTLPAWVSAWNTRDPIDRLKGTTWSLSHDQSFYQEPDDRPFEAGGVDRVFPHRIPADSARAANQIIGFSVFDSLTLDFTIAGIGALKLGQRAGTDFVSVSLSTMDAVGHRWGPGSREVHDHVLNMDRWLGQFLDSLGKLVPLGSVVITLTSDHGVTDFPEAGAGGRLELSPRVATLDAWARQHGDSGLRAGSEEGLVFGEFNTAAARYHLNVDSLASAQATQIASLPGVRRVYTPATLARAHSSDTEAMRWRRQIPPGFSWLVAVSVQPHWVFGGGTGSTGHGTTNPDDVRVPILFRIPGTGAARVERVVRTVDIAPTLAALLGLRPSQAVEGRVLPEVLRHAPRR